MFCWSRPYFSGHLKTMVTCQISSVLKQAIDTFIGKKEMFSHNLDQLRMIFNQTTASDVHLHPQFLTDSLWNKQGKAPVTYVDIYEDENISVGIFILKPGMILPLHDHPQMYGLIKVIAGKIRITSYSLNTERALKIHGNYVPHSSNIFPAKLTVEKCMDTMADGTSECCVLEPDNGNIHEIQSVGGPAAFIDILAPPYETVIPSYGPRKCTYYKILGELADSIFSLEETSAPRWYWNDNFPYLGPKPV